MPINRIKVYGPNGQVTIENHIDDILHQEKGLIPLRTNRTYIQNQRSKTMYAKWMKAPSGYYIAVLEYNNGHYYSYGRTADHLEKNIKVHLYQKCRVPNSMVHLEQQMSQSIDMRYATQKFISRYFKKRDNGPVIQVPLPPLESYNPQAEKEVETKEKEYVTEIDKDTNEMVVYKLKEVARYKLKRNEQ